eukprot:SAG25_NODE_8147_length_437_cov_0.526627_1_plen_24_part_10
MDLLASMAIMSPCTQRLRGRFIEC